MLLQHRRAFAGMIYGFDGAALLAGAALATLEAGSPLPAGRDLLLESAAGWAAWAWLAARIDLYASRRTGSLLPELWHLLLAATLSLGALVLVRLGLGSPSQLDVPTALAFAVASMSGVRIVVRNALGAARRCGRNTRTVVLVGRGEAAHAIARDYRSHAEYGIVILGQLSFTGEEHLRAVDEVPQLGTVAALEQVLRQHAVDEVLVCPSTGVWPSDIKSVIRFLDAAGLNCRIAPDFLGVPLERTAISMTGDVATYTIHTGFGDSQRVGVKRCLDIACALVALVVLSPVLLVIAAAIRLTSPGPVLFRQVRLGLHARPFTLFKFRSMVVDADALKAKLADRNEQSGPVFKMKDDPRVTPVGRFLRRYSLDELPQLWNVLVGDMSIVGPRPPLASEVDQYDWWQRRRLSVRPGLTCIWQVSGRNAISFERWMELDLQYIDGWSLAMDLKIMAKTVKEVLRGGGA